MISSILTILKPVISILKPVFKTVSYIKYYFDLKKAEPWTFTIATKTNVGSMLYTTGRVVSINLWQVVIDGYQVNNPLSTYGEFAIKLYSICGITPSDQSVVGV
ncbi:hypothetical protein [Brenneria uluponensis]|uniref:hypothetical protein n=1 Tax=Brenneria uluponensis TaxID=3057057 RepID=UPI0028E3CA90|nr:hypothetical protein [Brenneria ulupoensis]